MGLSCDKVKVALKWLTSHVWFVPKLVDVTGVGVMILGLVCAFPTRSLFILWYKHVIHLICKIVQNWDAWKKTLKIFGMINDLASVNEEWSAVTVLIASWKREKYDFLFTEAVVGQLRRYRS